MLTYAASHTETERTEQTYEAALMLAPHDADLVTNFALFKEEGLRDIEGAKRLLERALSLDPMDMECRIYYATLLADRCLNRALIQPE